MKLSLICAVVIALFGTLTFVSRLAHAEEGSDSGVAAEQIAEAREHLGRGEELYVSEDWEGALAAYQRAYELLEGHSQAHLITYNIGRCHEHLFQYGRAMRFYRQYLERAEPDAEDRVEVQAKVDLLETLLATIRIDVNIPHYEVWVDERNIGTNLLEILIPGGSHLFEIRAEGYVAAQQDITIPAQAERSLTFELEELAEEYRGIHQGYFWVFTSLTVVTGAVGMILGIMTLNEHDRLSNLDEIDSLTVTDDELDRVGRLALSADLLYGTAGLFAVTAIVLAFLTNWSGDQEDTSGDDANDEASRVQLAPSFGPGSAGISLQGSF